MKIAVVYASSDSYDYSLSLVTRVIYDTFLELGEYVEEIKLSDKNITHIQSASPTVDVSSIINTISQSDGVIFAFTTNLFAPNSIMQTFLDYLSLPMYKNTLKDKNCYIVTSSAGNGEKQSVEYMSRVIQYLGGYPSVVTAVNSSIAGGITTDENNKSVLEKQVEDFYRYVRQGRKFFIPTDAPITIKTNSIVGNKQLVDAISQPNAVQPNDIDIMQQPPKQQINTFVTQEPINQSYQQNNSAIDVDFSDEAMNRQAPQQTNNNYGTYGTKIDTIVDDEMDDINKIASLLKNRSVKKLETPVFPKVSTKTANNPYEAQMQYSNERIQNNENIQQVQHNVRTQQNTHYTQYDGNQQNNMQYQNTVNTEQYQNNINNIQYQQPVEQNKFQQYDEKKVNQQANNMIQAHRGDSYIKNDIKPQNLQNTQNLQNNKITPRLKSTLQMTKSLEHNYMSHIANGLNMNMALKISGEENFNGMVSINSNNCMYRDNVTDGADVTVIADSNIWRKVLEGSLSVQKAFMTGQIKVRGNFVLLSKFDQAFKF